MKKSLFVVAIAALCLGIQPFAHADQCQDAFNNAYSASQSCDFLWNFCGNWIQWTCDAAQACDNNAGAAADAAFAACSH